MGGGWDYASGDAWYVSSTPHSTFSFPIFPRLVYSLFGFWEDIEYGPRSTCYNISTTAMITWIADFVDTYKSLSGRYPMIYTTNDWWKTVSICLSSGYLSGLLTWVLVHGEYRQVQCYLPTILSTLWQHRRYHTWWLG